MNDRERLEHHRRQVEADAATAGLPVERVFHITDLPPSGLGVRLHEDRVDLLVICELGGPFVDPSEWTRRDPPAAHDTSWATTTPHIREDLHRAFGGMFDG